jgi:hypothetical protein
MNKTIFIGVFAISLLLMPGLTPPGIAQDATEQPITEQHQGPILPSLQQPQQIDSAEKENHHNPDTAPATDPQIGDPIMPEMNPSHDSPDAPVKENIEGPVEEHQNHQTVEEQKQPSTEKEPAKPAESAGSDNPSPGAATEPEQPAPAPPKRELTPALAALRDQVRRTLAVYQKMPFNTRQNTPGEIIDYCLPLGCDTEITLFDASGQKRANGIACLCWNYPCAGYEPLTVSDGHIAARLGYGTQSRPSQLLAMLAFARVQPDYPLRVSDTVRTVADLVQSEKLSCRTGADMSLKLIGLGYYADEGTWKDDFDQEWSLDKLIKEELSQPVITAANGGLDRLLGLSYVVSRRHKRNLPVEGQYARAEKYVGEFQNYAFSMQNADGSWGYFLSGRGANRDAAAQLRSSGCVLQWLALSLPEEKLDDQRLAVGIAYLVNSLNSQRYLYNLPALSSLDIAGATRALHALAIYDERLFQPADQQEPPVENNLAPATAQRNPDAAASR